MASERQGEQDVGPDVALPASPAETAPGGVPMSALAGGRASAPRLARLPSGMRADAVHALQRGYGNAAIARALLSRQVPASAAPTAAPGGGKPADAGAVIQASHPHLARAMSPDQVEQVQHVLDARFELEKLEREIEPLRGSVLSDDVRKREALQERINVQVDIVRKHVTVVVAAEKLLGDDVLPKPDDKLMSPQEGAFREQLYKQLCEVPVRAVMRDGTRPEPAFDYRWGPGDWPLNHEKGQIQFKHLMQIQKWNLDYQLALVKRDLEITSDLEKKLREAGGARYELTGKKLGELWGYVWNTSVKVAAEVGKPTGYVDDSQGKNEILATFYGAKGARAIIKAPDGWLHVYTLDSQLNTLTDLQPLAGDDDGHSYMLSAGQAVPDPILLVTGDGVELTKSGKGWRCPTDKNRLTTLDQFAIGAIFGDFWEDPNAPAIVGQIFIGVIPIVGQIADARDVVAGIIKMYETGGKDGKFQTAMALVGFIPLFGDALKAAKGGGKKAVVEAAQAAAPSTSKALAREIVQDAAKVAKHFGVEEVKKAFPNLAEQLTKALADSAPEVADDLAKSVGDAMEQFGGNAGAVVLASGGKWADLAKGVAKSKGLGEGVGASMQAWREAQIAAMKNAVEEGVDDLGAEVGRALDPPSFQRTGTPSFKSDVDISFLGKDATVYHNLAKRRLAERFGMPYEQVQKLLDIDIFTDPTRLLEWTKIEGKAGKQVEKALMKEAELNTFAKMLRETKDPAQVKALAKQLGVDMAQIEARAAELGELAANPAKRAELELQMDVLHNRLAKETTPEGQAAIAQQMAEIQGKLNASVKGAYATPGGVLVNVALRDNVAEARKIFETTPALRYMAVLDDMAMLQPVLARAADGFDAKLAKDMAKYADRLVVRAGQLGAADVAGPARGLFDEVDALLTGARKSPADVAIKAPAQLAQARGHLVEQLGAMITEARRLADLDPAAVKATGLETVTSLDAQRAAVRAMSIGLRKGWESEQEPAGE